MGILSMGFHVKIHQEEFTRAGFQNDKNRTTSNLRGFIVTMFFPREQNVGKQVLSSALYVSVKSDIMKKAYFFTAKLELIYSIIYARKQTGFTITSITAEHLISITPLSRPSSI